MPGCFLFIRCVRVIFILFSVFPADSPFLLVEHSVAARWMEHMTGAIDQLFGFGPAFVPPEAEDAAEAKQAADLKLPPRPNREDAVKHLSEEQRKEVKEKMLAFFKQAMTIVLESESAFQERMVKQREQGVPLL